MMLANMPANPRQASSMATRKVREPLSLVSATYAKQPANMALKSPERPLQILPMRNQNTGSFRYITVRYTAAWTARPREGMIRTRRRPARSLHEPSRITINSPTRKPPKLMYRLQCAVRVSTSLTIKIKGKNCANWHRNVNRCFIELVTVYITCGKLQFSFKNYFFSRLESIQSPVVRSLM